MKAAWLTDIHINFLSLNMRKRFYEEIRDCGADVIFITGDIAEAPSVCIYLEKLREVLHRNQKVYFVAGNHDYYNGDIKSVHENFDKLSHGQIKYLPHEGIVYLTEDTSLVGVDGWADGKYGDYENSPVVLNDSIYIGDLYDAQRMVLQEAGITKKQRLLLAMQELANKDASALYDMLDAATSGQRNKVIILTHIPPFPEASLYNGKVADEDYLPFYTCFATGEVIMEYAKRFPHIEFKVFCGHSHNKALYEPLSNLTVKTGEAQYYQPQIQEVFDI